MGIFTNQYTKSLLGFFKYGILLAFVPPFINYAALNQERNVLSSHGLPYDIGLGQKLFLSCKGKGLPTVIADAPIGMNSDIWLPLQEKLAQITKVCVYDRAGLGASQRPVEPKMNKTEEVEKQQPPKPKVYRGQEFTIERMVEDLRRLITSSSQQDRPIMFVGSEFGSMIARFYTQIYDDKVSHLVMINPMVEGLFSIDNGVWRSYWYEHILPKWYSYAIGSTVGLNRILLMTKFMQPQIKEESCTFEQISSRQKHLMCNPKHMFSLVDELSNLNETLSQMKLIWTIKQFPANTSVTILTSKQDTMFAFAADADEIRPTTKRNQRSELEETWRKSVDYLKNHLHPSSTKIEMKESIYRQLSSDPQKIFEILRNLILKWREANNTVKVQNA